MIIPYLPNAYAIGIPPECNNPSLVFSDYLGVTGRLGIIKTPALQWLQLVIATTKQLPLLMIGDLVDRDF